jgi:midasin
LSLQVFPLARKYYASSPPLFEALSQQNSSNIDRTQSIARTAYSLLAFSPQTFASIWNWKPFIQLCASQDLATRRYAAKSVAIFLGMEGWQKERMLGHLGLSQQQKQHDALALSVKEQELVEQDEQDEQHLEHAMLFAFDEHATPADETGSENGEGGDKTIKVAQASSRRRRNRTTIPLSGSAARTPCTCPLHPSLVSVCGVTLRRKAWLSRGSSSTHANDDRWPRLLHTASTRRNLRRLAVALCQSQPILVEGCAGSGKSSLLKELARLTGNTDAVRVQMSVSRVRVTTQPRE